MGHNGGPDWRAMLAGEDAKALEVLSRLKNPTDVPKTLAEQRAEITRLQQLKPTRLADDATPEQIAEYRKGIGLPEIGKEAKGEDYIKAFKIETPKELSNVQRGMIEDYAKTAYEQGHSPREVKSAVDFYLKQEAANIQAANTLNENLKKEWHGGLRDRLGSKEYDAQLASINAWTANKYADRQDDLANFLHGQLPGGGLVKDHPILFDILSSMAMNDGFTDHIMANSLESNGETLMEQIDKIEKLQFSDRVAYDEATKPGGKYDKLLNAAHAKGLVDEFGNKTRRKSA